MGIQLHDLALLTARFGAARFGASRFGFIPCPDDVLGTGADEPGAYVWTEQTPESQIVDTDWTLQNEDCACRDLCTIVLGTITPQETVHADNSFEVQTTVTGILGSVSGVARVNWGDGGHTEQQYELLVEGDPLAFTHTYNNTGTYTITITLTDERGCSASKSLVLVVASPSSLAVTYEMSPDPLNSSVDVTRAITFTPDVTPGVAPYTYNWDFGDGTAHSALEIPTHTYNTVLIGGTYTCLLTVTDNDGAEATYSITFPIAGI